MGQLPASQQVSLTISLPMRNTQALEAFIKQLHDPSSPQYGKYLTAQQFTEQFGPTQSDYAKVIAYVKSQGMVVTRTHTTRMVLNVSASAAAINKTFAVTMKQYKHPTENRMFFAPDAEPTVEAGLPILDIHGLSTYEQPHPMLKKATADEVASSFTTGAGPSGQFLGSDMRAAYAPGVPLDGTGQAVGLVELGPYNLSDVQNYFNTINQPLNVPVYNVLLGVDGICSGTPTTGGCDDGEEVIDMEQAISMAPHLSALIVYETNGPNTDAQTAFAQAAEDDVAKQISLSFGWSGTPATEPGYEQVFLELQAQGQNVFVSSGDSGANVGGVGYPGNSSNITAVGGTDLTTTGPGGAWSSESGWVGSGGGWNTQSPIPSYQTAAINSTNQGSTSYRNIPDVSMEANTDNYYCANGGCYTGIGGTSLSAPRWAGFLSLANEQANGTSIGFLNTMVYSLGQTSSYNSVFHDITMGNDFNSGSPDLFTAVTGYDLVTGWGTPNGQSMLDTLGPVSTSAPNFTLSASPATIPLRPGESGQTTITATPTNGFTGTVNLTVTTIGAPAGVTATLDQSSITANGSATLNVTTTSSTPAGNLLIIVTGASQGISQAVYVSLALPDFGLTLSPTMLYLNQSNRVSATSTASPENGFKGKINFSLTSGVPAGVLPEILRGRMADTATLVLAADRDALTGVNNAVAITAQSSDITQSFSSAILAVSAATGEGGAGVPVNLSSAFNVNAAYSDGTNFSTQGGLGGFAYSSNLLTPSRILNGVQFRFGKPNTANAVAGAGQRIALPAGRFKTLQLLASGVNGNQSGQVLTVAYTDGTTAQFTQGFSDWFTPSSNLGEAEAVAMPHRNTENGTEDDRQFNLYGYSFPLDETKEVKSLALPNNSNVLVLAATLVSPSMGASANLASAYNATGIYTDGSTFPGSAGIDTGGEAYSANLLGDQTGTRSVIVNGTEYDIAAANQPNIVYGIGMPISLPEGRYDQIRILGTGLQGAQTDQQIVLKYKDGSKQTLTQSFSDWFTPQEFPNESEVFAMPYRDNFDGSQDDRTFNLYQYILSLDGRKEVASIELPNNRFVVVLAITLTKHDEPDWQMQPNR
ncbi:S53 family peptidase [Terracidiphilus gabretensis]|uniref:S53 family peptidase n=1 Tax=Terracidiphilus gabretensis TaxID=1577687 RepID=UPI00071C0A83|nr:S53 family peptidase [Terracidiphilus gabretensis]